MTAKDTEFFAHLAAAKEEEFFAHLAAVILRFCGYNFALLRLQWR